MAEQIYHIRFWDHGGEDLPTAVELEQVVRQLAKVVGCHYVLVRERPSDVAKGFVLPRMPVPGPEDFSVRLDQRRG